MKSILAAAFVSAALVVASPAAVMASPKAPVIALSNAYYGNTWRHQMVGSFEAAASEAKKEGKIGDLPTNHNPRSHTGAR